jgi:hypothetical protein
MMQDAANVVQRCFAQPSIIVAWEQWLIVLPQTLMYVHTRAVIAEDGLWHKGRGLIVPTRHILDDVLEPHHLVRHLRQRWTYRFRIAGSGHLMVLCLTMMPSAEVAPSQYANPGVYRWGRREVALLNRGLYPRLGFSSRPLFQRPRQVNEVIPAILMEIVTDVIEDNSSSGPKWRYQPAPVCLRNAPLLGNMARITRIAFARDRVNASDHGRWGSR